MGILVIVDTAVRNVRSAKKDIFFFIQEKCCGVMGEGLKRAADFISYPAFRKAWRSKDCGYILLA